MLIQLIEAEFEIILKHVIGQIFIFKHVEVRNSGQYSVAALCQYSITAAPFKECLLVNKNKIIA